MKIARRHEVGFYPDDASLLVDVTQFIGAALKAGHCVEAQRCIGKRLCDYAADTSGLKAD